ncbi:tetratricopeptide repeat protein [Granulicella sp. 5B5]|uniref:tetratricopeptide repeat protein n=1 Tax=Granulicella sp. 5B5 TaxID=1617967 RepID=UPI0015F5502B|nr:tetratricopeptide repeat protein [Granulicella sp. 5B5]QMV17973.1 tetratricopeptide repeat protein [Granulicella sp. 5B5]
MATKSAVPSTASKAATQSASTTAPQKAPRTLAGRTAPLDDAARKAILTQYEAAIKLVYAGKFDKAHEAFTKILPDAPADIAPSVRMYLATCEAEISKHSAAFSTPEERYDYAISLLNHGHYEDAREHFEAILKDNKSADYAFYGMALLAAMTCDSPRCIEHLTEAIRLNPQNRTQARLDSDFESVADDPSFTELLYPEPQL